MVFGYLSFISPCFLIAAQFQRFSKSDTLGDQRVRLITTGGPLEPAKVQAIYLTIHIRLLREFHRFPRIFIEILFRQA